MLAVSMDAAYRQHVFHSAKALYPISCLWSLYSKLSIGLLYGTSSVELTYAQDSLSERLVLVVLGNI